MRIANNTNNKLLNIRIYGQLIIFNNITGQN